jgi:tetratricopeptide (TPR) repeat protein
MAARSTHTSRGPIPRGLVALSLLAALAALQAAGSDPKPESGGAEPSAYDEGLALVETGDFAEARARFEAAAEATPDDPDVLNMLAFTQRKTDRLDAAFATYARALEAREHFPQARQYLGEAHVHAAMEQILMLKSYGAEGEAHLATLVDALTSAAEKARTMRPTGVEAGEKW